MPRDKTVEQRIDAGFKEIKTALDGADGSDVPCTEVLKSCSSDPNIIKACKAAGANPKSPSHLAAIFKAMAAARFERKPIEKVWTAEMLSVLLLNFMRRSSPDLLDDEICARVVAEVGFLRRPGSKSASFERQAKTLVRKLNEARDPAKNKYYADIEATAPELVARDRARPKKNRRKKFIRPN